jgi:hypothetical protein
MRLIFIYMVLVAIGEVVAFGLGRMFEEAVPAFSMLIYMALFFGVLVGAWPLAVTVTERWFPARRDAPSGRPYRS